MNNMCDNNNNKKKEEEEKECDYIIVINIEKTKKMKNTQTNE
jgi:hypothetical protein